MSAKFLIAKYAPDVKRMEPRNIGVIVWLNGETLARFVGESQTSGVVSPPKSINASEKSNYREWVGSWRRQLSKPFLEVGRGVKIERKSPEFVAQLAIGRAGNYMLVEGGEIADAVSPGELPELTDYLYRELVDSPDYKESSQPESARLRIAADNIFHKSGLADRPDFQHEWPAAYRYEDIPRRFDFDYAIGPVASPYSLYHRVALSHQWTFDAIVLNLEWFIKSWGYAKNRIVALITRGPTPPSTQAAEENRRILEKFVTVVDVGDEAAAKTKIVEVSSLNGQG